MQEQERQTVTAEAIQSYAKAIKNAVDKAEQLAEAAAKVDDPKLWSAALAMVDKLRPMEAGAGAVMRLYHVEPEQL